MSIKGKPANSQITAAGTEIMDNGKKKHNNTENKDKKHKK
jgi:hypothetical protein